MIKKIMRVNGKTDIIDIIEKKRLQWYGHVKRMPEKRIQKLIMEWIPEERRKSPSKKNVDGWSTSSHDSKKFRTRSMEKQGAMAFGFRKTVTAVIKSDRICTHCPHNLFVS
jgi:Tfp pilus assembly pilus retraction ATPase PilT